MNLLNKVNLSKINKVEEKIELENIMKKKKEIEAVEKDSAHIKFEKIMDQNKEKIKKIITYNSDEKVMPFNHTNYEVATILNSKKIFR